jgi:hypothetical protein
MKKSNFDFLDWGRKIMENPKINARREVEHMYYRLTAERLGKGKI